MKLLKFGAVWCPGCLVMNWRLKKIKEELPWLELEEYDYDQDKAEVEKYQVGKDIPIFIFLDKEGEEFARRQGEIDRRELLEFLEENRER